MLQYRYRADAWGTQLPTMADPRTTAATSSFRFMGTPSSGGAERRLPVPVRPLSMKTVPELRIASRARPLSSPDQAVAQTAEIPPARFVVGHDAAQGGPEIRGMAGVEEVSQLVGGAVVHQADRRLHDAPVEAQHPGRVAGAPAARLAADQDTRRLEAGPLPPDLHPLGDPLLGVPPVPGDELPAHPLRPLRRRQGRLGCH